MINTKIVKLVLMQSGCCLCGESIAQGTQHVQIDFHEKGHMSRIARAHMYCADDFADTFQSEITRRNAAELKERDNPPRAAEKETK